jgi:Na+/H+ antiporter NhaA
VSGYVAGKPLGIGTASWLSTRLNRYAPGPPIGWLALAGGGSIAGIGFTVSLLIAGIAFAASSCRGEARRPQRCTGALLLSWIVFRTAEHMPDRARPSSAERIMQPVGAGEAEGGMPKSP